MACSYNTPIELLSGTGYYSSVSYRVSSNFVPVIGSALGKEIRSIRLRLFMAPATSRTFRYLLLYSVSTGGGSTVYQVYYASSTYTMTADVSGTITYNFSPYVAIPNDGKIYYGAIQQGPYVSTDNYRFFEEDLTNAVAPGADICSSTFGSFLSAGGQVTFTDDINYPDIALALSVQVCENDAVAVTLTPAVLTQTPTVGGPTLTVDRLLSADSLTSTPEVAVASLTNTQLYAAANLDQTPSVATVPLNIEGQKAVIDVESAQAVDSATFSMTIPLTPAEVSTSQSVDVATRNTVLTLSTSDLTVAPAVQTALNFSLSNMVLSNNSSRTPDAGIDLSWEESGVPKAYSWYDKPLYKFHLEFEHITEDQCLLLEDFCELHRYDEIDYQWPFDSHTYRCILTADVKETIIRADTALGVRCNVSLEMLGYEVA